MTCHQCGATWCHVVETSQEPHSGTRISVTIPPDHYEQVCRMAKAKKVSNAWIIRDTVEKYIEADSPFYAGREAK